MRQLQTVLAGCGPALADVRQVRVYLLHVDRDCATMNAVCADHLPPGRQLARTGVGFSGLAQGALNEIDMAALTP